MKKIVTVIIVFILIITVLAGCSAKSDYQIFMEAMERTEAVENGKMSMDMEIQVEFNKEGLSEEAKDIIEFFEDFNMNLADQFDKQKEQSLKKIFVQAGDMGIDIKLYTKEGIAYVITPLIPKILVVDGEELLGMYSGKINEDNFPKLSQESLELLEKVWTDLYNKENVAAIEDIVLDTPEGRVKARKFEVKFTDEQMKPATKKSMEIFMQDKQLIEGLKKMINFDDEEFSIEDMFKINMEMLDQSTINSFEQVAYIDRDNYVIDERISIDNTFHFTKPGTTKHYTFNMNIKRWDLNKEPDIHFPEVNFENSITLDDLKEEYPEIIEGMKEETR